MTQKQDIFLIFSLIQCFTWLPYSKIKSENENYKDRRETKITGIHKSRFLDRYFDIKYVKPKNNNNQLCIFFLKMIFTVGLQLLPLHLAKHVQDLYIEHLIIRHRS